MPIALPPVRSTPAEMFVVVIGTSVITGDVIKSGKGGLPSPLYLAMDMGLVRVTGVPLVRRIAAGVPVLAAELLEDGHDGFIWPHHDGSIRLRLAAA